MSPGNAFEGPLEPAGECRYRIPKSYKRGMRVDGLIYADETLIETIRSDNAPEQVANVATLPGIQKASLAMPDIHWGYGFPIGGVAATDPSEGGVVSPGGVGYDINCGVRMVRSDLALGDVQPRIEQLLAAIFQTVPCGVGVGGRKAFAPSEMRKLLREGAAYIVRRGQGWEEDLEHTETGGCLDGADPDAVSKRAQERGKHQVGSLGAGNHFLEVQVVDKVFDTKTADAFGVAEGGITFMIHCGSRGFGHQVCDDFLKIMRGAARTYGFDLPDQQLCCAPVESDEGRRYLGAMRAAANYAWANRQALMVLVREAVSRVFGKPAERLGLRLIYDVAHNIAKVETHTVDGRRRPLCVHRKGATRAFPAGHPEVPEAYRDVGQPVLIPGDMGRYSFLMVGLEAAMDETFGSVCHGAGRAMSRSQARRTVRGEQVRRDLAAKGILAMSRSPKGLAEEYSGAYKDVANVVDVVERAGLARRVCRLRPLGVVKG
ncbi:MAG: tRNA-splicing ligase [Planctomycetes bacterium DG_20]|nr:MAG: tRNA-splicing ligase [Planctomycetes bacterium DG_20]